jgi:type VI secretion system secreted protein Hcp
MAMIAYMYAKGQKSGPINGSVTQKGRENSVQVVGYSHEIVSPRDPQSGLPTGQRMHKPLIITKQTDKSTPIFYQVMCTNENLTSVTIKFWTPQLKTASGVGSSVQHYTVTLTNANIAQIQASSEGDSHAETTKGEEIEKISFTYQKIEWTWTDGGITAGDDWEARV